MHSIAGNPEIAEVAQNTTYISGPINILRTSEDCIVVTLVRNGGSHIKQFIDHYLALGFKHIILMDNGSQDSTISIAQQYENVSIWQCLLPFRYFKDSMRSYLLNRFSYGKWCLLADVDEFFDYPYRERVNLQQFINYLNQRNDSAVLLQMLDMYPDCNIQDLDNLSHQNFRRDHCFFETDTLTKADFPLRFDYQVSNPNLKLHYGGVRKRLFGGDPLLSKLALVKPHWPSYHINPHWRSSAKISDVSCVLFHYKFTNSFSSLVETAISEKQYHGNSREYFNYHKVLSQKETIKFVGDSSLKFEDLNQLLEIGFLQVSKAYIN